jgi:hypothetical protein
MRSVLAIVTVPILVAITLLPLPVDAACQWRWDCTGGVGACRQVPVCDNSFDVVPPRPPEVAPIPTPSVRPVPTPTVPPVGASSCMPRYMCRGANCTWETICR